MQQGHRDTTSRRALIAATIALVAIVAVAAAFFLGGRGDQDQDARASSDQAEQEYSFKAYTRNDEPKKEAPTLQREQGDDPGIPDEFEELAEKYGDQEVVVIEEHHEPEAQPTQPAAVAQISGDEANYEPGQARPVNQPTRTPADYQRQRYGTKEQHRLLREFNAQLDRGERPVIPKARIPGQLRAFSPQIDRELKVNANSRFIPGKLQKTNGKLKPVTKTPQIME